MQSTKIEIGDIVSVNFNGAQFTLCHRAKVFNIPHMTGDSWIVKDLDDDKIHYISELCTITLLIKQGETDDE